MRRRGKHEAASPPTKTQESCRPGIGISETAALLRYGQRFGFLVFGARRWLADLAVSVEKSKNRKNVDCCETYTNRGDQSIDQRSRSEVPEKGGGFLFPLCWFFSLGFFVFSVLIG